MDYLEVAQTLENHVKGNGGSRDWESFTDYEMFTDPYLLAVQQRMIELTTGVPMRNSLCWSDIDQEISHYVVELRQQANGTTTIR